MECLGHYGNHLAVSVFINMCIVSKSPPELSTLICAFMGLQSCTYFPCLKIWPLVFHNLNEAKKKKKKRWGSSVRAGFNSVNQVLPPMSISLILSV